MTARWFTDPATNGPSVITPTFTPAEHQAFSEILSFALDPANTQMELLICMDAAGTCEHGRSTGRKAAPSTPEIDAAIAAGGGVRQWHNHPSQDSLSHFDWLCAGLSDVVEILALNAHGSIFVGRIVDWDDRLDGLFECFPRLAADLEMHVDSLAKRRGLAPEYLVAIAGLTGHMLNTALANTMPVRYAYAMNNADLMTIAAADSLSLIGDGVAFAQQAIQVWLGKNAHAQDAEPL